MRFLSPRAWRHDLLEVVIDGEMPEELPRAGFLRRFIGSRMTFCDFMLSLRVAKEDPNLSAVIFHVREPDIGWARAWEIRDLIRQLRHSGLATTAFLESADNLSYYIASACDEIFLVPSGDLKIRGLAGEVIFLKKGMDRLGVKAELLHEGKYKSAGEMFTRASISPSHREEINDMLDNLFDRWIADLARDRRIGEKEMKSFVDKGSFLAEDAKKAGLVDRLCYYDEIKEIYEDRLGKRPRKVKLDRYDSYRSLDLPIASPFKVEHRIAILYATGSITSGRSSDFGPTGRSAGADTIAESLHELRDDPDISGVVLRVDSPGGSALASDLIWREIALCRKENAEAEDGEKKPFIVSMGDVAASGGYYIASMADKIFAGPATITGSIGVIGGKFNIGGLAEMLGINVETVTRGKTADMDNAFRGYTPTEKKIMQEDIKSVYKDFIDRVATGRSIDPKEVEKVAKGRVWLGAQAVENKLVDEIGGLLAAIDEVKKQAGIPLTEKAIIDVYPKRKRVVRLPIPGLDTSHGAKKYMLHGIMAVLPREMKQLVPLLKERGPLAIIPYFLRIK